MSWILEDWRLKLLALALAVLMLGAVAFSQNPPTSKTLSIPLTYGPPSNLVIINPPATVSVTFTGLSDVIGKATADNFKASADASHATPGQAVKLNIVVAPTIPVTVQNPAPIIVQIDIEKDDTVPVTVNATAGSGWLIDPKKTSAAPSSVHFTGPASWEKNLTAVVNYPSLVVADHTQLLNQPIQLQNSNGALSLFPCTTVPCAALDVPSVSIDIYATTGSTSSTVPFVDAPPSNLPPPGYRIVGISISPATVIITGDQAVLARYPRIVLPAVDLSSYTSRISIRVQVQYPNGVTSIAGIQQVTITYDIEKNPSASPSP